ncbi:hypothetical protein BDQ12DRAFT_683651 [Crucibulum laeve]|uniref:Uncharacterized protein n=1 Tax=Crucibulum laeve TaxID=68775 RepID=A0A5C3LYX1_9AGAR|nr:hypothetical protein BDQ12DRAFT_683651 [Crucibulum laeve]
MDQYSWIQNILCPTASGLRAYIITLLWKYFGARFMSSSSLNGRKVRRFKVGLLRYEITAMDCTSVSPSASA